jgi:3-(3-hydroxy-phenyl)propionate hydroxylase
MLHMKNGAPPLRDSRRWLVIGEDLIDTQGLLAQRLDASPGATYLIRPDQHLAARWRHLDGEAIEAASHQLNGATP